MIHEIRGVKTTPMLPECVVEALEFALIRKHAIILKRTSARIEFTSPFVQMNWNLLATVSHGIVSVERCEGGTKVEYWVSLYRCRLFATFFSLAAIAMAVASGQRQVMIVGIPTWLTMAWGWLYGMNFIISSARLANFFETVLAEVATKPPPLPKE